MWKLLAYHAFLDYGIQCIYIYSIFLEKYWMYDDVYVSLCVQITSKQYIHKRMYDTVQTYTHIIPHTWEYTMDYRILEYIRTFSKSRVGRSSSHVFPCFRKGRSKHRRSSHSVWKDSPPLSVWQLESSSALLCTCMKCSRKRARFHPTKKRAEAIAILDVEFHRNNKDKALDHLAIIIYIWSVFPHPY